MKHTTTAQTGKSFRFLVKRGDEPGTHTICVSRERLPEGAHDWPGNPLLSNATTAELGDLATLLAVTVAKAQR